MADLDPRLAADTEAIAQWPLSRVLLMKDAAYPWLILVPDRPNLVELFDLDPADRARLSEEIARAAQTLKRLTGADKINVGALGNVVAQLHIHVVARFRSDPAWPGPVWGKAPPLAYPPELLAKRLAQWREALA